MTKPSGFRFGQHVIPERQVFFQTALSYAFTNIKPVVPGHILVSPKRVVCRVAELTPQEAADLMVCAHKIAPMLQKAYDSSSLTIAIQDGKDAGQSVAHVHMHVMPRKAGDFSNNDDVYHKLEKEDGNEGRLRSLEEMVMEAEHLEKLLVQ
ncbi:hypothetical protein EMCRGX_G015835 [Ephydatia muelleri]